MSKWSKTEIQAHMSYCNILAKDLTRESVLEGLQKRHVYGATDNILADVRSGTNLMGVAFSTTSMSTLLSRVLTRLISPGAIIVR